jgi:hypothetical protein
MTPDKETLEQKAQDIYNRHFKSHFESEWEEVVRMHDPLHDICLSLAADFLSQQPQDNLPAASAS